MEYISDMNRYLAGGRSCDQQKWCYYCKRKSTVCGKPAIFIPSPHVTGNHQYFNAKAVAEKGGAVVIEEKDLDHQSLVDRILQMKKDPEILRDMAEKSLLCAPVDAAGVICDNIREFER